VHIFKLHSQFVGQSLPSLIRSTLISSQLLPCRKSRWISGHCVLLFIKTLSRIVLLRNYPPSDVVAFHSFISDFDEYETRLKGK